MKKRGGGKKGTDYFIHGGRRTIPVIATGARFTPARGIAVLRFVAAEKYVDRSIMNEIFNVLTRSPHANHGQTGLRPPCILFERRSGSSRFSQ